MSHLNFFDFHNDLEFSFIFEKNNSLIDYINTFKSHNINLKNVNFICNFTIIDIYKKIDIIPNNTIIIIKKNFFQSKKVQSKIQGENNLDIKTNKYLSLLQKHVDLISFIIILKTENIEYIMLYLEKYKKKNIYNLIKTYQKEIIDMIENNNHFIDFYIRTCNINIIDYITSYSNNNLIIQELEELFPDVPLENFEDLIEVFQNN